MEIDITEHDSLEEFMVDYHKEEDTHEVPSRWLQKQLIELNSVKIENEKLQRQEKANSQYLQVLKNRVDNLILASEIREARIVIPERKVRKYLDIKG